MTEVQQSESPAEALLHHAASSITEGKCVWGTSVIIIATNVLRCNRVEQRGAREITTMIGVNILRFKKDCEASIDDDS